MRTVKLERMAPSQGRPRQIRFFPVPGEGVPDGRRIIESLRGTSAFQLQAAAYNLLAIYQG